MCLVGRGRPSHYVWTTNQRVQLRICLANMRRKFSQEELTASLYIYDEKGPGVIPETLSHVSVRYGGQGFLNPLPSATRNQNDGNLPHVSATWPLSLREPHHTTLKAPTRHIARAEQPAYILCLHPLSAGQPLRSSVARQRRLPWKKQRNPAPFGGQRVGLTGKTQIILQNRDLERFCAALSPSAFV